MPARHQYSNITPSRYPPIYPKGVTDYDGIKRRFESRYVVWHCPTCTWYRYRTNTETWEQKIIQHPLYGFVTNYQCYEMDVANHDCQLTRDARIRLGVDPDRVFGEYEYDKARDRKRGRDYEEFTDDIFKQ